MTAPRLPRRFRVVLRAEHVEGVLWSSGAVALHRPGHPGEHLTHQWRSLSEALRQLDYTDAEVHWIDAEDLEDVTLAGRPFGPGCGVLSLPDERPYDPRD